MRVFLAADAPVVVGTEAIIVRASALDVRAELQWDRARLTEPCGRDIRFGVAVDQHLDPSVVRAGSPQVDLGVSEEDLTIQHAATGGADRPGQLEEDVVSVLFLRRRDQPVAWINGHVSSHAGPKEDDGPRSISSVTRLAPPACKLAHCQRRQKLQS